MITPLPNRIKDAGSVRVEALHKSFKGGSERVLQGVNIDFPPGQLTYLLGGVRFRKVSFAKTCSGPHEA